MAKKVKDGRDVAPEKLIYALSKSMLNKLDPKEREGASEWLWTKSAGLCALCGNALQLEAPATIVPDHYVPEAKGGETSLANLYLAHRSCNSSRQDLDFEVAQPLTKFRSLSEHQGALDFDRVLREFVPGPNGKPITFELLAGDRARIGFGHDVIDVPLWQDPATGVRYFFCDVPIDHITNDREIQPRVLMVPHVRKLALDFLERPVHEPSNCRLVMDSEKVGRLLQFDGQHKATAQILIGRKKIPTKIYIEPPIGMLQSLVIKIQQEIKKQPLTRSETLAKIGDVVARVLEEYKDPSGKRTEKGLINSQPKDAQREVKSLYLNELMRIIFFDEDNKLVEIVRPGSRDAITTDKVICERIISPLLHKEMLDVDLDVAPDRDVERKNIIFILNSIAEQMLPASWNNPGSEVQRTRAENFFYQGSIGWWVSEFLIPGLKFILLIGDKKPLLTAEMDETQRGRVQKLIEAICSLSAWSTTSPDALKAMRSNTVKNVEEAFPGLDLKTVMAKTLT